MKFLEKRIALKRQRHSFSKITYHSVLNDLLFEDVLFIIRKNKTINSADAKKPPLSGGFLNSMVGHEGFEPSTNWLKANCSTTELMTRRRVSIIEIFLEWSTLFSEFLTYFSQKIHNLLIYKKQFHEKSRMIPIKAIYKNHRNQIISYSGKNSS